MSINIYWLMINYGSSLAIPGKFLLIFVWYNIFLSLYFQAFCIIMLQLI